MIERIAEAGLWGTAAFLTVSSQYKSQALGKRTCPCT